MNVGRDVRYHFLASLVKVGVLLGVAAVLVLVVLPKLRGDYGASPLLDSRTVVWFVMELHLMFAAFVLGVPIFATIIEVVGAATKDDRYDRLAWEFTRLLALAFTTTAVLGVLGLATLVVLYPKFMTYLGKIFSPTYLPYAVAIVADAILLIIYYYAWDAMKGRRKWLHIGVGALLNIVGTALMCIANAWTTFMMSPAGVTEAGGPVSLSQAVQNPLWWPINIHRLIANVAFGGGIAAAYAAIRFLARLSGSTLFDESSGLTVLRGFTPQEFRRLAAGAGFGPVTVRRYFPFRLTVIIRTARSGPEVGAGGRGD